MFRVESVDSQQRVISLTEQIYRRNLKSQYVIEYSHKESESQFSSDSEFDDLKKLPTQKDNDSSDEYHSEEEAEDEQPKWIIRESGKIRFYWDLVVISFAIYTSILTPFLLAFSPSWGENVAFIFIDWVINIVFIIDIGINFRTTYINTKTGKEIWDSSKIAKKYVLGGKFWIDLLSSIPFDGLMIESISFLNALGMLKLIRTARISKIIQHLDVNQITKTYLKTVQLLFNLLLFIHLQA